MKIGKHSIKTFVVCVQEYPERTKFILNHFNEVGLLNVNVWNGFNANLSGLVTTHTYDADNPNQNYRIGAKPVSTWISFYSLWQALTLLPDEIFLICEWDAKFHPNWKERSEKALNELPAGWGMAYLGSCCTEGKPKRHLIGDWYDVKGVMCGHATLVHRSALPILLSTQRKVFSPLDISVAEFAHPKMNVATLLPRCVDQWDTHIPN